MPRFRCGFMTKTSRSDAIVSAAAREAVRRRAGGRRSSDDAGGAGGAGAGAAREFPGGGPGGSEQARVARAFCRGGPGDAVVPRRAGACTRRRLRTGCPTALSLRRQADEPFRQPRCHSRRRSGAVRRGDRPRPRAARPARRARAATSRRAADHRRRLHRGREYAVEGVLPADTFDRWRSSTNRIRSMVRSSKRPSTSHRRRSVRRSSRKSSRPFNKPSTRWDCTMAHPRRVPRQRSRCRDAGDRAAADRRPVLARPAVCADGGTSGDRISLEELLLRHARGEDLSGMGARAGRRRGDDDPDSASRPAQGRGGRGIRARRSVRGRRAHHGQARSGAGTAAGGGQLSRVHLCEGASGTARLRRPFDRPTAACRSRSSRRSRCRAV